MTAMMTMNDREDGREVNMRTHGIVQKKEMREMENDRQEGASRQEPCLHLRVSESDHTFKIRWCGPPRA